MINYINQILRIILGSLHIGGMKTARLSDSTVTTLGDVMVKPKLDGLSQENVSASAGGSHDKKSPTADWARAVAMLAAMNKPAALESKPQLPKNSLDTDFNVVRARKLSCQN